MAYNVGYSHSKVHIPGEYHAVDTVQGDGQDGAIRFCEQQCKESVSFRA